MNLPASLPPHDGNRRDTEQAGVCRTLSSVRSLRVSGRGRIVMRLNGTGRVTVRRGRFDDFCFEGRGVPKHLSAEQVHLDKVEGTLTLEGMELQLEFRGGRADAMLTGRFEIDDRAA